MTKGELKAHCIKQIQNCEQWAEWRREEPHGKVYEEHKLILKLLEQGPVLDKIRAEIEQMDFDFGDFYDHTSTIREMVLEVIDKYKE